ncbi:hypothetical protein FI146_200030 [Flavobacterium psychrophilum]|nr:hypothetical protein FI146_200030 [Flavobacterium psychrophilum]
MGLLPKLGLLQGSNYGMMLQRAYMAQKNYGTITVNYGKCAFLK